MTTTEATVAKAARLYADGRVHQTIDGLFFVEGNHGNYKVEAEWRRELRTNGDESFWSCDCPSTSVYCSHILAAVLHAEEHA